jgi:hypothetical protein
MGAKNAPVSPGKTTHTPCQERLRDPGQVQALASGEQSTDLYMIVC